MPSLGVTLAPACRVVDPQSMDLICSINQAEHLVLISLASDLVPPKNCSEPTIPHHFTVPPLVCRHLLILLIPLLLREIPMEPTDPTDHPLSVRASQLNLAIL